ncbi:hypothetical protein GE09DRAFT_1223955 [Coniochaeta sp. 2T2.1]|nr:hypothetical protein GE09DRAFT_1223955 [Coniochaeta sp. 2T2.1]
MITSTGETDSPGNNAREVPVKILMMSESDQSTDGSRDRDDLRNTPLPEESQHPAVEPTRTDTSDTADYNQSNPSGISSSPFALTGKRKRVGDDHDTFPAYKKPRPDIPPSVATSTVKTSEPEDDEKSNQSAADDELEQETWITAFEQNLDESPIYQLPTELILMIASHLPDENKYVLQQVSRRFQGVYDGPDFSRKPYLLFPTAADISHAATRVEVQKPIRQDMFCQGCLTSINAEELGTVYGAAKKRLEEPMYCAGCARDHPAMLFSISQRGKGSNERVCIGREGCVRICAHKVLYWSDVENTGDNISLKRNTSAFHNITGASSGSWISLLDPDSYDIQEPDMLHELWCS